MAQWLGRWLMIERSRVRLPASPLPSNNSGQVVHTRVPLAKQYNLVPAKGRRRFAAGKVTVGLASHWPCVTDSVVYPPTGSTANVWEMSTPPKPHWGTAPLPFLEVIGI